MIFWHSINIPHFKSVGMGILGDVMWGENVKNMKKGKIWKKNRSGAYILENTHPPPGGKYQPMSFGEKLWKGEEKKGENVKEKGRKGGIRKKEESGK